MAAKLKKMNSTIFIFRRITLRDILHAFRELLSMPD